MSRGKIEVDVRAERLGFQAIELVAGVLTGTVVLSAFPLVISP